MRKSNKYTESELPPLGSVFLAPLRDGKFTAIRVIRSKTDGGYASVFAALSSWIGRNATRPSDSEIRKTLVLTHHSWKNTKAAQWVSTPLPSSFVSAGTIDITSADEALKIEAYGAWEWFVIQSEKQWRWEHDRQALLAEEAVEDAKKAEERRIAFERRAEMLRTITLDTVQNRTWFENWDTELDGPNLVASRRLIEDLVNNLKTTPKITKAVARRSLRVTVKNFNRLDEETHFIETTHREDICDALEIVMAAVRYPELVDEIESLRDW